MRKGCLLALLLYAAIVTAYRVRAAPAWDPPATWLVPLVAGLITFFALGALWGARDRFREWSLLAHAQSGLPLRDGRRAAVVGTIHPVGAPLETPFTRTPAVLYEYEVRRPGQSSSEGRSQPEIGLGGFRMEPCVIRDGARSIRLLSFPLLDDQPERRCTSAASIANAREFIARTQFDDVSGLKAVRVVSGLFGVMADDDGSIDKNWSRSADGAQWLHTRALDRLLARIPGVETPRVGDPTGDDATDDEFEQDLDDEFEGETAEDLSEATEFVDAPQLVEKSIAPGEQVCVFGIYDEMRRALVASLRRHNVMVRIERGDPDEIVGRLRRSAIARTTGGLITLVIVHVVLWGATALYQNHPTTIEARQRRLYQAAHDGDLAELERLLGQGADANSSPTGGSLLATANRPEVVEVFLRHGADVNAPDASGYTPLMNAARYGRTEIVEHLIKAGAELDLRSRGTHTTALMQALDAEQDETVALLREAGAFDDTVTAATGSEIVDASIDPVVTCVRYIEAIHAADAQTLSALSATGRGATFEDVEWETWHNTRPAGEVEVAGYANAEAATFTIQGLTPGGFVAQWRFQMVCEDGRWKVLRETWLTRALERQLREAEQDHGL